MRASEDWVFEFADFVLAPRERVLVRGGKPIALTAKAFDLLVTLVRHSGHLISKDDLLRMVWPDRVVEEVNLTVNIYALRKALGRGSNGNEVIQTVPTHGTRSSSSRLRSIQTTRQHINGTASICSPRAGPRRPFGKFSLRASASLFPCQSIPTSVSTIITRAGTTRR
jgi:DNA-binding winged helix-turn-helix (wHTH) protein